MARNELTKNARTIADLIYRKASAVPHNQLARLIGISESQFSRTFSNNVEMVAMIIDELDIALADQEEMNALRVLARKALECEK
ncbi:CII family transcriptional regulator [Lonepinella sp. MS14436]|uniref:CII family transcriptional regulator n=1 Tax=Lonepinella sp. MS14436 TaxID=3003619 RepID=UPI0036DA75C4